MSSPTVKSAPTVLDLATGELRFAIPLWIVDGIVDAARHASLRYPPASAFDELGAAYRSFFGRRGAPCPHHSMVTAGGKEGVSLALSAVVERPGAAVLLPEPGWPSYRKIAEGLGATVSTYVVDPTDPSLASTVAAAIADVRPIAVVLNFPHNPTGAVLDDYGLDFVMAAAARVGATVVSDEVYLQLRPATPSAGHDRYGGVRRLIVDSASKWLAVPGLRIGWLSGDAESVRWAADVRSSSVGTTVSSLSAGALLFLLNDERTPAYVAHLAEQAKQCLDGLRPQIEERGDLVVGEGPIYAWVRADYAVTQPVQIGSSPAAVAPGSQFGVSDCFYRVCPSRSGLVDGETIS